MNILQKAVSILGLDSWFGDASRQDGTNFRTDMVTLAEYQDSGVGGAGGVLGLAAAWACVNLLAGTIASLPLMVYRTDRQGRRTMAGDHPLYRVLHDSPNADQTALDFWEFICACLEMHGNAYCEVERGNGGRVIALSPPLSPEVMQVRRLGNGDLEYRWSDGGRQRVETQARILHIRGFGGGPLGGMSTLAFGRRSFGMAQAIERAASATFSNGVRTSGVMSSDKAFTAEQRKEGERLLQEKYSGAMNAGVPMLLDNGLKWQSISINPEDAQMLESRAFSVEEICRFFGTPPHMIGHTAGNTQLGSSITEQTRGFEKFTLRRRCKRIEQSVMKQLLTAKDRAEGITIEFNMDGLLRGSTEERAKFYESALKNKWRTINEVRALENEPPVPWGDRPWGQQQDIQLQEDGSVPAAPLTVPPQGEAA